MEPPLHILVEWVGASLASVRLARLGMWRAISCGMTSHNHDCTRCGGSGVYRWGGTINGVSRFSGVCFRCNGSGSEPADTHKGCKHGSRIAHKAPAFYVVQEHLLPGEEVCVECGKVFAADDPSNWTNQE